MTHTMQSKTNLLGHELGITVEYTFFHATPDKYDERTGSVIMGDDDRVEIDDVLLDGHSIRSALRKNKSLWRDMHDMALNHHLKKIL